MATQRQIQANRLNARRSTGPRTAEGKAASSANAIKHGLRAQRAVLPGEDLDQLHALVADLEREIQPATAIERALVHQLADTEWRMLRAPVLEAGVLANQHERARQHCETHPERLPADPALAESYLLGEAVAQDAVRGDTLTKLSRYQARLSRSYFKALDHLYKAQDRRQAAARSDVRIKNGQTKPIAAWHANGVGPTAEPAIAHRTSLQSAPAASNESGQTNPIPVPATRPAKLHKTAENAEMGVELGLVGMRKEAGIAADASPRVSACR